MDDKNGFRKPLPAIRTATDNLKNLSPARSRTDPPAPEKHHDKSHLHKRLHSSSLRSRAFTSSREHGYRQAAKETVQSAIELKPPISFDALLRRDKKSPDSSRRGSTSHQNPQHSREVSDYTVQQTQQAARPRVRPEDVEKAKKDNAKREQELRDSLKSVEEVAMSSTRQLDDTYYAILEKASLLRTTVASLQQLTEESRRMHATFKEDTEELERETRKNLDGFGNFDQQEKTINELVSRLSNSKDRTTKLNERLEAARTRVAEFEQREKEKQKARRIRYSAIWAVIIGILVFIIAVVIAKKRSAVGSRLYSVAKALDDFGHDVVEIASPVAAMIKPTPTEDSYLKKLFDEL
ncbi:hypothetical protein HII31_01567 [Pseudocercospora fuligena]|uniref:Uncharacterized protein n=1 Tax=Pseudocercospora fuligena TaxID=685502 RepID=A0A8H6VNU1_9PEZI|nr:hypothetical protein HII31_01567 [Pseudocercospora fuligena]